MINLSTTQNSNQISPHRSTSEQILEILRRAIIELELQPGQRLSENEIAKKFNLSRSPVREAFIKLSNLRLVEIRPQRGTFVSLIDPNQLLEAQFIRESLEIAVVSSLSGKVPTTAIERCESLLKNQEDAAKNKDRVSFVAMDDQLHQTLANATGFPRVGQVIQSEKVLMDRVRFLSLYEPMPFDHLIDQHKGILKFLVEGQKSKAVKAMQSHLRLVFGTLKMAYQRHPDYFQSTPEIEKLKP